MEGLLLRLGSHSPPDGASRSRTASRLAVLGVRHHTPACARLVRETIDRLRPAFVLIEGPADMNARIGELRLPHELPVAVFSFHATPSGRRPRGRRSAPIRRSGWRCNRPEDRRRAAVLRSAGLASRFRRPGEPLRRPAHEARGGCEIGTRRGPGRGRPRRHLGRAGRAAAPDQLAALLNGYFDLLRPEGAEDVRERGRERFMAAHAAWALRQEGDSPVVLVCGGWHAGAIRRLVRRRRRDAQLTPLAPDRRAGSYLVPYAFHRLDSFTGYESGMPSPALALEAVVAQRLHQGRPGMTKRSTTNEERDSMEHYELVEGSTSKFLGSRRRGRHANGALRTDRARRAKTRKRNSKALPPPRRRRKSWSRKRPEKATH